MGGLRRRLRAAGYVGRRDAVLTWTTGLGFPGAALALAFLGGLPDLQGLGTVAILTVLFVIAFRTEFTRAYGATVATEPVLLALALCAPLHLVPLAVAVGTYVATIDEADPRDLRRGLLRLGMGAHSLGLVAAVAVLDLSWDSWSWPAVAAAFACQALVDAVLGGLRARLHGASAADLAGAVLWTVLIDALLGVIGIAIISVSGGRFPALLLVATPILLIWILARDRQATYEEALTLETAYDAVAEQARIDPLTGVPNRRVWDDALAAAADRDGAPAHGRTVTVLLADLDHLKFANDTIGHDAGDRLLVDLARVLRDSAPAGATVARIGGDEFGVLVVGGPGELPPDLVSPARAALAAHAQPDDPSGVPLSASLGQAAAPPSRTVREAVGRADAASRLDKVARRARRQDHELTS